MIEAYRPIPCRLNKSTVALPKQSIVPVQHTRVHVVVQQLSVPVQQLMLQQHTRVHVVAALDSVGTTKKRIRRHSHSTRVNGHFLTIYI